MQDKVTLDREGGREEGREREISHLSEGEGGRGAGGGRHSGGENMSCGTDSCLSLCFRTHLVA